MESKMDYISRFKYSKSFVFISTTFLVRLVIYFSYDFSISRSRLKNLSFKTFSDVTQLVLVPMTFGNLSVIF